MNTGRIDYPYPPHYYRNFENPDSISPPKIQKIAKKNKIFFQLGNLENFWDKGEKIFPNYLEGKKILLEQKGYKEDLKSLINKLHESVIGYVRALAENPEILVVKKKDIDDVLYNIFYLLKIIRVKYQARNDLAEIYDFEIREKAKLIQEKISRLKKIKEILKN